MNAPATTLNPAQSTPALRHDWTRTEILSLFDQPFADLMFAAQQTHRAHFDPNAVQISTLLSIKTGACPEDCAYCPQSPHYKTELDVERLLPLDKVLDEARTAKAVTVTELVGWEHSMKNELIIASKTAKNGGRPRPAGSTPGVRQNARERAEAILRELNIEELAPRFTYY